MVKQRESSCHGIQEVYLMLNYISSIFIRVHRISALIGYLFTCKPCLTIWFILSREIFLDLIFALLTLLYILMRFSISANILRHRSVQQQTLSIYSRRLIKSLTLSDTPTSPILIGNWEKCIASSNELASWRSVCSLMLSISRVLGAIWFKKDALTHALTTWAMEPDKTTEKTCRKSPANNCIFSQNECVFYIISFKVWSSISI